MEIEILSTLLRSARLQAAPISMGSESELLSRGEDASSTPAGHGGGVRHPSIYSLTMDEFQHTLADGGGKNFGSMNMDDFLNSIWTAEENNQEPAAHPSSSLHHQGGAVTDLSLVARKQPSLSRQGSLTLPAPLCRKTVEEVWSEIHSQQPLLHRRPCSEPPRQPTFGEMTLEDFLIKAGVVRSPAAAAPPPPSLGRHPPFLHRTGMDIKNCGPPAARFGGRVGGSNGGAYGAAPVSPTASNGGMEMVLVRGGRLEGVVERVVERRQRRMIKNRESAARSRARKQAYTVELEAELKQVREENAELKRTLAELERKRKQQYIEELKRKAQSKAQDWKEKPKALRRNSSCFM